MTAEGLELGSVLDGRYRIDSLLGAGGMGRVYRGEHVGIGRAVAIKVLHADMHRNREAAQRFQREALASGRLDHVNIVGVSDFGVLDGGAAFLVMEALEGTSLGYRIEQETRLPWQEAIAIMRGILAGLRHAHDRGVVHRDIKPDNVFLAVKGGEAVVKILDFGIAKLYAGNADDPASTSAGLTVGTPAYLSPEQAVGGEITPKSDLYSASIVLFEMISGRVPFEADDPLAMLGAHIGKPPPRVRDVAPDVEIPEALEDVLQRGLVKQPAQRISSADEYLALLDAVLPATAVIASPSGIRMSTSVLPAAPPARAASTADHAPTAAGSMTPAALGVMPTAAFEPVSHAATMSLPPARVPLGAAADARKRKLAGLGLVVIGIAAVTIALLSGSTSPMQAAMENPGVASARSTAPPPAPAPAPAKVGTRPVQADASSPPAVANPEAAAAPAATPVSPTAAASTVARDRALNAALTTLAKGKSCAARKAAIPKLVALRDRRAIEPLKRARRRMSGGLLGLGERNANACLKAAADAAIAKLGGASD